MKSYTKCNTQKQNHTEYKYTNYNFTIYITRQLKLHNFTNSISIKNAHINRTIPIPALYQIETKLTQSLTRYTHNPAAVLLYYSIHMRNSRTECNSYLDIHRRTRQRGAGARAPFPPNIFNKNTKNENSSKLGEQPFAEEVSEMGGGGRVSSRR